jgi:beta-glucosidase
VKKILGITMNDNVMTNTMLDNIKAADYKNPLRPIDERVADLLNRMTLEEKVAQMLCIWDKKKTMLFDAEGTFRPDLLPEHLKHGIGQIARLSDTNGGQTARGMAELANELQKYFVEGTRLGIPVIFHEECLHGLAAKEATSYPQPIGLASTFDPVLVESLYAAIADDARSRGAHQALTPVVDVARDPRWGRVEETFGEDTYLAAQMGIAAVKGFQGDARFTDKKHVIATLKHFAAHGQPESGMNCGPVNISERVLRDTFLSVFRDVIRKAGAISVMASYNEIDGVSSHASKWLLRDVLRGEWGFTGYVVSDYYAVAELHLREEAVSHSMAKDKAEAAKLAVDAGVNIEFPDPDCYPNLVAMVRSGEVREEVIDELVAALLTYKFVLGLFDDPYVDPALTQSETRLENDRPLALRSALETITLLKNDGGLLPLDPAKKQTIAVIGPNADRVMLGGYSGTPKHTTTVLQGIKEKIGGDARVVYSEGCKITVGGSWNDDPVTLPDPDEDRRMIRDAVAVAQAADLIVLVVGDNEQTSREAWNKSHMGDRACLDLFGMQNELVRAMIETGKEIVVVLFNGRPVSINAINERVPAVLECWYLGQEAGTAIADVLFGNYNPGGKLPISVPRSAGHLPCYYNYKPSARRGYLADDVTPLFPFGFGLSYTTFAFSTPVLDKTTIATDESVRVSVDVTNTGGRIGDEVVQLYIRDVFSSVTRPVKELKGFTRITLGAGETQRVVFTLLPEHLAFTNIDKQFVVEPGEFTIMVGSSSRDEDLLRTTLIVR